MKVKTFQSGFPPCSRDRPIPVPHEAEPVFSIKPHHGTEHVLPVAGSQAAIQTLPRLRPPCRVAVPDPGYGEHAKAWRRAGHEIASVPAAGWGDAAKQADVLVIIHPNNPTGQRFRPETLLDWHRRLAPRDGWLVIDEAFIDPSPAASLAGFVPRPGLIVLRSLGKFFGLAGARVGFVLAEPTWLQRLRDHLGPWTLSGPSRWVAARALADRRWQEAARARLKQRSARLAALLEHHDLAPAGGCGLFQWTPAPRAAALHEALARGGILTRLFAQPPSLRLGLPGGDAHWARPEEALADIDRKGRPRLLAESIPGRQIGSKDAHLP